MKNPVLYELTAPALNREIGDFLNGPRFAEIADTDLLLSFGVLARSAFQVLRANGINDIIYRQLELLQLFQVEPDTEIPVWKTTCADFANSG